jgi:hypothetical protein
MITRIGRGDPIRAPVVHAMKADGFQPRTALGRVRFRR